MNIEPVTLFEGEDLAVRVSFAGGKDCLALTFSPRSDFGGKAKVRAGGFGEAMFLKEGVSFACFISKKNHWWQSPEMHTAAALLAPHLATFPHVFSYGTSMGAYGALVIANLLRVDHVLACSPQVDVTGALPLHPVWVTDLKDTRALFTRADAVPPAATRVSVVMDPSVALDQAHYRALARERPVERLLTPFSGHSSALFLSEIRLLKELVLEAAANRLDIRRTRNKVRARRGSHPVWCERVASRLEGRGASTAAHTLRARAVEVICADAGWDDIKYQHILSKHIRLLLQQGDRREAKQVINRLIESGTQSYSGHVARASLYLHDGQARKSIPHARKAAELRPKLAPPYIILAAAMVALGEVDKAERFLAKAEVRRGALPQEWTALASAFIEAGAPASAARATEQVEKSRKKKKSKVRESEPAG